MPAMGRSDFLVLSNSLILIFQFPNLPQVEDYHIIDMDNSHLLIIWCHGLPEFRNNGALVASRTGNYNDISDETLQRFKKAIKQHGLDEEKICIFQNSDCLN